MDRCVLEDQSTGCKAFGDTFAQSVEKLLERLLRDVPVVEGGVKEPELGRKGEGEGEILAALTSDDSDGSFSGPGVSPRSARPDVESFLTDEDEHG